MIKAGDLIRKNQLTSIFFIDLGKAKHQLYAIIRKSIEPNRNRRQHAKTKSLEQK
ncbi:hypothetical protein [Arabidopsis thaliana]|uniref:Uncharacterized protein AT4g09860 n=1 Tax=Arabidopsis thaliana TaxID=3702 RepID=Q9SZA1_ARATH|nr:uncharacterized protein AT4G09860 [Arabidopsis thaliana]AEE82807.1 hypothetical protein AT4G09860 [Arabidopsis thaliana]CAB39653.1 hypothetical protein [Arabidopsis thaliana]CAB78109.1 hypothetical protein [Arabidopsis thaliana]|eukprot:NP_192724.1 hypothetical protein AT4G09860 [Arabidopsis thaliana]